MTSVSYHVRAETLTGIADLCKETQGDPRICIAVLDGTVDESHPSLVGANLKRLESLVPNPIDHGFGSEHGTHTASIIFGQHNSVLSGLAPRCTGLIIPIFQTSPNRLVRPCSQIDLARAILLAAQNGAHIINVSGGEFTPSGTANPFLVDAVRYCTNTGILIVAAAGNDGCECLHVPAAIPSVLAVGAVNVDGVPLGFSNWGRQYQASGIVANGENILGAGPDGGIVAVSGTSPATAIVSGVAGLLMSLQLKMGQTANPLGVRLALLKSARNCIEQPVPDCRRLLAGRLNVLKATTLIKRGENIVSDSFTSTELDSNSEFCENDVVEASSTCRPQPQVSNSRDVSRALEPTQVMPSSCGCDRGGPPQLVFAIGRLGVDFGSESRRDSIAQHMGETAPGVPGNPYDPKQLIAYLDKNPWEAASITWTLSLDATVIYAIVPSGPFASEIYKRLREFLSEQMAEGVERISIPGVINGKTTLSNGQTIPAIVPDLRGMYSWTTSALVESVAGQSYAESSDERVREGYHLKTVRIADFLERVYFEMRNLGVTPQDRAINFAATNAFSINNIYEAAIKEEMDLDRIEVERSPVCRPDSDCWDVKLMFFFPQRQVQSVCKVYRFTIDVSDVVPVTVGPVRSWFVR